MIEFWWPLGCLNAFHPVLKIFAINQIDRFHFVFFYTWTTAQGLPTIPWIHVASDMLSCDGVRCLTELELMSNWGYLIAITWTSCSQYKRWLLGGIPCTRGNWFSLSHYNPICHRRIEVLKASMKSQKTALFMISRVHVPQRDLAFFHKMVHGFYSVRTGHRLKV